MREKLVTVDQGFPKAESGYVLSSEVRPNEKESGAVICIRIKFTVE